MGPSPCTPNYKHVQRGFRKKKRETDTKKREKRESEERGAERKKKREGEEGESEVDPSTAQ